MTQQATCFQYCKILRCYLNILFSGRNTPKLECQMLTSVWKGIKIKNAYFVLKKIHTSGFLSERWTNIVTCKASSFMLFQRK